MIEFLFKTVHSFYPVEDKDNTRFPSDVNNSCSFCDFEGETTEHGKPDCFHTTALWFDLQK